MLLKEAISKRIYELCENKNYTPNKLAETSIIPPSTLYDVIKGKTKNPSTYLIYQICKSLDITIKDFFDSQLFSNINLDD